MIGPAALRWTWAAVVALLLSGVRPAHGAPPELTEGIMSVRVGPLPAATMVVLTDSVGTVFLPLARVVEMAGFASVEVDAVSGSVRVLEAASAPDGFRVVLGARVVEWGGEAFVPVATVGEILAAEGALDWRALEVRFSRTPRFPAAAAREGEARRERFAMGRHGAGELVPFRGRTGGLVLDWTLQSQGWWPGRGTAFSPRLGTAALGGELTAGGVLAAGADGELGWGGWSASYRRVFPGSRVLRQVEIGDVMADGASPQPLRGVRLTNQPHRPGERFGPVPMSPDLPPGWEWEVYDGSRLVGYGDRWGGSGGVDVRYGSSPLRVRAIGPNGEVRTASVVYEVPYGQVPAGSAWYTVGAGACRWACRAQAFGSVRFGLFPRVTAGGGVDVVGDSAGHRVLPHLSASFASGSRVVGDLLLQPGGASRGSVRVRGTDRLGASASIRSGKAGGALLSVEGGARSLSGDIGIDYRMGQDRGWLRAVRLSGGVDGGWESGVEQWRVAVGGSHRWGYLEGDVRDAGRRGGWMYSLRAGVPLRVARGGVSTSLGATFDSLGLRYADAGVAFSPRRWVSLSLGAGHSRDGAAELSLGVSAALGNSRLNTRFRSAERLTTSNLVTLTGGVALERGGATRALPVGVIGAAGVSGAVYFDRDGDGERGPADSAAAGVLVRVGGTTVQTGRDGGYGTWGVEPYEAVEVRVDDTRQLPFGWTPATGPLRMRATPHISTVVDIPLVRVREVSGRVVLGDGRTLAGVTVVLIRGDGEEEASAVTFADGEYYLARVRPGTYRLEVRESTLRALGATATPATMTVPAAGDSEVEAPTLHLVPVISADRSPERAGQTGS